MEPGRRAPLRAAFDYLRDELAPAYERKASELLRDPWQARDEYINVVLDRDECSLKAFFARHGKAELTDVDTVTALALLEMQRHAMLMYTSCGWFFDELSGIETVQVIEYAGARVQLAADLGRDHRGKVHGSWNRRRAILPSVATAAHLREVGGAGGGGPGVGAHFAIGSCLSGWERAARFIARVTLARGCSSGVGAGEPGAGKGGDPFDITREREEVSFGVLHFGDQNVIAGVRGFRSEQEFKNSARELRDSFQLADLPAVLRLLDKHFDGATYSLRSLFRDERQKVVSKILGSTMDEAEAAYRQIYEHHAPLMGFLSDMGAPLPKMLHLTAEFVLNTALRKEFLADEIDVERIQTLLDTAAREKIQWDERG